MSDLPGMPPGEVALYQPRGAPEQLLGLPVEEGADGVVIGESRRPGCEVVVKHVPASWTRHFGEDVGRAAMFEVGRNDVAGLAAEYGRTLRIESEVSNKEVLRADLRGSCGEKVINAVYVGTGWREVQFDQRAAAKAGINVEGVPAQASASGWDTIGGRLEWDEAQAWAFEVGSGGKQGADLVVKMPAELEAGERFRASVEVKRPVWLLVLYKDAAGDYGIVMPSPTLDSYYVPAGETVSLPEFEVANLEGHAEDFETLMVFGFTEEADFDALRPPPGSLPPEQTNDYAKQLQQKLEDPNVIPRARWTAATYSYRIIAASE